MAPTPAYKTESPLTTVRVGEAARGTPTKAYAALQPKAALVPYTIDRRAPREDDVVLEIAYCGICHTDLFEVNQLWNSDGIFPMVPGHEIVGTVAAVGPAVTKFRVGDRAAVGCMVDSCGACPACVDDLQQYCERGGKVNTYNSRDKKTGEATYGGYSTHIVVKEAFTLRVPDNLDLAKSAPLLCAGITTYAPLKQWGTGPGKKVGIVGLGGLGHIAVKIAAAMGAEVTCFTTSPKKRDEAHKLGAHKVVLTSVKEELAAARGQYDLLLDTVSAYHDLNLGLLKRDGVLALVGAPEKPLSLNAGELIFGHKCIAGSLIGGIKQTQEMLDFCGRHSIGAEIELIPMQLINEAYERLDQGDVHYRFVIDIKNSLAKAD